MKVVHCVCFDSKFIPSQIEFLNQYFKKHDQIFYLIAPPKEYMKSAPANVKILNKYSLLGFIGQAKTADRVIFNGLFLDDVTVVFSFLPLVTNKAVWIPWGGDLYRREIEPLSLRKKFVKRRRSRFIQMLYGIATPVESDYIYAKKLYGTTANYINAGCNIFEFDRNDLDSIAKPLTSTLPVRIQIGNSGDPTNEHCELLESLRPFKDEQLEIHAPLAYGDANYIATVINRGKELFGNKFVPNANLVPPEEYNRYLASIDILVFNHQRQQGFRNLAIALYLGSKVYIRKNVSTWAYLSSDMGCKLFDTNDINDMPFSEFIIRSKDIRILNRNLVSHLFDRKWQQLMWAKIYK